MKKVVGAGSRFLPRIAGPRPPRRELAPGGDHFPLLGILVFMWFANAQIRWWEPEMIKEYLKKVVRTMKKTP